MNVLYFIGLTDWWMKAVAKQAANGAQFNIESNNCKQFAEKLLQSIQATENGKVSKQESDKKVTGPDNKSNYAVVSSLMATRRKHGIAKNALKSTSEQDITSSKGLNEKVHAISKEIFSNRMKRYKPGHGPGLPNFWPRRKS